jgi:hypothetical protein
VGSDDVARREGGASNDVANRGSGLTGSGGVGNNGAGQIDVRIVPRRG